MGGKVTRLMRRNATVRSLFRDQDTNTRDGNGLTLLMDSCGRGDIADVSELLSKGADPNRKDNHEWSALHYLLRLPKIAICEQRDVVDVCELLLRYGADPNAKDISSSTPLMHACKEGLDHVVSVLLSNGAEPKNRDRNGRTALRYLSEFNMLNYSDQHKTTTICESLLEYGADPNTADYLMVTALMYASRNLCYGVVGELLCKGADPNIRDVENGRTALEYLWRFNRTPDDNMPYYIFISASLLRHGANPRTKILDNVIDDIIKKDINRGGEVIKIAVLTGKYDRREILALYEKVQECNDKRKENVEEFLNRVLETGFTLKELCRLNLRQMIRSPLAINVMSCDIEIPKMLKKYILFE